MDIHSSTSYPLPTLSSLQLQYLNKRLSELPTPAAIIDRAVVKRNCNAMLQVCRTLGVGFRAHIKSHKTLELSKLQVGPEGPANFIVSTLIEAENLLPFMLECQAEGRYCSILYGVPIPPSSLHRLLTLASKLRPGSLSIILDNPASFTLLSLPLSASSFQIGIFIKIDTGYQRAGIKTTAPNFQSFVKDVVENVGKNFRGFYSHFGHSYGGNSEEDAAEGLIAELEGLEAATQAIPESYKGRAVLTVGATPTATAAQNMLSSTSPKVSEFTTLLARLKEKYSVELHAGVYPLLDMQQLATHARPSASSSSNASHAFQPLSTENIGLRILLEVSSVYTDRAKPECLVSAGSVALGREPCKAYPGWGVVTPSLGNRDNPHIYDINNPNTGERKGWIVGRISQEHGILSWEGPREECKEFEIGAKVMVWLNHACMAGAGFGWYLVVDGDEGDGERVVDVWGRWRGW